MVSSDALRVAASCYIGVVKRWFPLITRALGHSPRNDRSVRHYRPRCNQRPVFEALEPRVLFSADAAGLLPVAAVPFSATAATVAQTQPATAVQLVSQHQTSATTQAGIELIVIDASVPQLSQLLDDLQAQAQAGRHLQLQVVAAGQDGFSVISAALAQLQQEGQPVTAVHLIGHGQAATMRLGDSWIDGVSMRLRADEIASWSSALTAAADLLLYGCDFAASDDGIAVLNGLAQLTGAEVAASTDATGAATLRGNWILEYHSGAIEAAVAPSATEQAVWQGELNTYVVTNANDSGAGSLRQAISLANGNAGADTISFNIAGTGVHTINLLSVLPTVSDTVTIDASTDDSFAANGNRPAIGLNGNDLAGDGLVLASSASGSVIRGFVSGNFAGNGITIQAGSNNNAIAGNYIGRLTYNGTIAAAGNENTGSGISVLGANNTIGGTLAADRNVISGNTEGVYISGGLANANAVLNSYIGVDATASAAVANTARGIRVDSGASSNIIGQASYGNVVSGNTNIGIHVIGGSNNVIQANTVGLNAAATAAISNGAFGVAIDSGATATLLGGTGAGQGNVISGNTGATGSLARGGVYLQATNTTVQGNIIGLDASGTTAIANGMVVANNAGIYIFNGTTNTLIGGTAANAGNIIAGNVGDGIMTAVSGPGVFTALGNRIYSNSEQGIDLNDDAASANDAGDGDAGPNDLQNFPVLSSANANAAGTTIVGSINSNASTTLRVEFFANRPAVADAPNGEGERYLGFITVSTDGSGNATINTTLANVWVNSGDRITATATVDLGGGNYGSTSEFAMNVIASATGIVLVDTTSDVADGVTSSISNLGASRGADGRVSLREAIIAANNTANGGTPDKIVFNIGLNDANHVYYRNNAVAGTFTAAVSTTLADAAISDFDSDYLAGTARSWYRISLSGNDLNVTQAVIIDGSTQAGYDSAKGPVIELNAAGVSSSDPNGLTLSTGASTVRGLVINRAGDNGLEVDAGADGTVLVGNYFGTDVSGTQALGNSTGGGGWGSIGIKTDNVVIGGLASADRNLISGNNGFGIELYLSATGTIIRGNYIGTNADGSGALANTAAGITLRNSASSAVIGGTAGGAGNLIAFNGGDGVWIQSGAGSGTSVLANTIHSNTELAVDLGADGVTANDANDVDTGANGLQNFPLLTSVNSSSAGTTIAGSINTNANTTYRIEFFANRPSVADASGYGEGEHYLGFITVTTDGMGNATINTTLANVWVNSGDKVTATATVDLGSGNYGSTSEFAANISAASTGIIVVDTTSDLADGTTTSISNLGNARGADGRISLREAILAANNTANGGTPDKIVFEIAAALSGGVHTIYVGATGLPAITQAVIIDGSTEPDFAGTPVIQLNGGNLGSLVKGVTLGAGSSGSTVRGLIINGFTGTGIEISGSNNQTIQGNWIGLGADGVTALGNAGDGIKVQGASTGTLIGTDANGTNDAAERNVISGNATGVYVSGAGTSGTVIAGNTIGLAADGNTIVANSGQGVSIVASAATTTIGGATSVSRNVISGNAGFGIYFGSTTAGNTVLSNYIGSNAAGTSARPNNDGVWIDGSANNTIGQAGAGNLISGNTYYGVAVDAAAATGNVISANLIGTDAAGTAAVGNGAQGILVSNGASSVTIGGTTAGRGNTVAFNAGDGIYVSAGSGISILGNSFHSNTDQGIDLGAGGVTANDAGDGDNGANDLQNFPVLTSAVTTGAQITVSGSFNSTASTLFRVEFFASALADGSTYGEGQTYLGFASVTTDGSGNATINATLSVSVVAGAFISATATNNTSNNTSEFAQNVVAMAGNTAPVLDAAKSPALVAVNEDAGAPGGAVGTLVSALVDFATPSGQVDNVTDPDGGALLGIAMTAADAANGAWWYSTNGGAGWNPLGAVSNASARLLAADANTRLYFQPNANVDGTLASAITFRAWDRTSGTAGGLADTSTNGGTAAFSTATDTAALVIAAFNDAPVNSVPGTQTAREGQPLLFNAANSNLISVGDVDAASGAMQVTLTGTGGTITISGTSGLSFSAGDGTADATMTFIGTLTNINTALNGLGFMPTANVSGGANLQISTSDQGNTGTGGAQSDTATVNMNVAGFVVTPISGLTTTEAGGTASFSIVLRSAPAANVNVGVSVSDATEGSVAVGSLTFTNANWSTPQTVTVTGVDDSQVDGNVGYSVLIAAATSSDANYNGVDPADVSVTTVDNDSAAVMVTPVAVTALGSETRVNTTTTNAQSISANANQALATDANGNFVVVWSSNLQDGALNGIYAQRFNADGTAQGSEFRVNSTTADDQINPAVAIDGAGNFVAIWSSINQDGSGWGVYGQRYNAAGVALGSEFLVNNTTSGNQLTSQIAMSSSGAFVIAWSSDHDVVAVNDIYARRYDAAGVAQGAEFRVNTYTTNVQQLAAVAMSDSGNFVVTWASNLQDGSNYGVYGQLFAASGAALGSELRVNTTTAFSQLYNDVAMLPDGRFVVVYQSVNAGGNLDLYLQRYAADGTAIGSETQVNSVSDAGYFPIASVSADAGGNMTVVWNKTGDGAGAGTYGRRFYWSGTPVAGEFLINTTTAGDQWYPEVASQAGGRFIVAWGGNGPGDADGVFFQRYGVATSEALTSATFQIGLTSQPSADVTITIASGDATEGSVGPATMTFTPANWNVLQTVTVSGLQDFINDGDITYNVVTSTASSADGNFNGLAVADMIVTNREIPNLAPVNTVPGAQTINEDATLVFSSGNGNLISISDADAGSNALQIMLTGSNGVVTLSGLSGLTFTTGDGSADATMTFTGTLTNLNAALAGVSFVPTPNFNGTAGLQIVSNDQGNSGTGGALSATDGFTITVNPVNDSPTAGGGSLASIPEDTLNPAGQTVFTLINPSFVDVDAGASLAGILVTFNPQNAAQGAWQYSTDVGSTWFDVGAVAYPNTPALAANTLLRFLPVANYNGSPDVLSFRALDDSYSGGFTSGASIVTADASTPGGSSPISATLSSISTVVTGVNDPPAITSDGGGASAATSVAENSSTVTTVTATDPDLSAALAYTIIGGADASRFTVNSGTGALSFVTAPDFEVPADAGANNIYDVIVQVSDGALTDTQAIALTVTDVIEAGIIVVPLTGLVTTEAGGTAQFTMALNGAPSADVTISVTSSNPTEATVSSNGLTFTSANWNIAQTVTLTGIDDLLVDGSQAYLVNLGAAVSADLNYNGLSAGPVAASNTDNDTVNTFYVTNNSDLSNGNTSSIAALLASDGGDGISLREAIKAANNTVNGPGGADVVLFNVAGAGVHTISLLSQMDSIGDPVTIDGRSQPGYISSPLIEINGTSAGAASGLIVDASNTQLRGLVINGFAGGAGIALNGGNSSVQSSYIGTDATATIAVANGTAGIFIASANNLIGGVAAGVGNIIAGNPTGVVLAAGAGVGNAVLGNSIYGNSLLAIDLLWDGVSANDLTDADTGSNNLQNFPVLTDAVTNGVQLTVVGGLNSVASTSFRIEVYANSVADPSGYGQGQRFIGAFIISTDGAGNATINNTLAGAVALGEWISATATNLSTNDTSEFAFNVTAVAPPIAPVIVALGQQAASEDIAVAVAGLSVSDANGNLSNAALAVTNGTLTVSLLGGAAVGAGANGSAGMTLTGSQAQINAALASLSYVGNANFNGTDTLNITARDATMLSSSNTVTINVAAVNDPPSDLIRLPAATVTEGAVAGTSAGTIIAIDPDDVTGFAFNLLDDAGHFAIDPVSGALTVMGAGLPAYDLSASYTLIVRVTDSQGGIIDRVFTIAAVRQAVAAPPVIHSSSAASNTSSDSAVNRADTADKNDSNVIAIRGADEAGDAMRRRGLIAGDSDSERRRPPPQLNLMKRADANAADGKAARVMAESLRRDAEQQLRSDPLGEEWLKRNEIRKVRAGWLKFDLIRPADDSSIEMARTKSNKLSPADSIIWEPDRSTSYHVALETAQIGGVAMSIGMMLYALRAGGLVAAMLTALPAWSSIDPLVVLAKGKRDDETWSDTQRAQIDADEAGVRAVIGDENSSLDTVYDSRIR